MVRKTRKQHTRPRVYGKNKKGESCANPRNGKYGQACCPHAPPVQKTSPYKYATTVTPHVLTIPSGPYKGKYRLMTCCKMCGDSMKAQATADPEAFAKKYGIRKVSGGSLVLKNPHTGKATQVIYPVGKTKRRSR